MDTKTFNDLSPEEYKKQTQAHWTSAPCGSGYSDAEPFCKEYFEEIESHRYRTHPWIRESIKRFDVKDKRVLEIGFGMGTDHLSLARRGARMYGIDLTPYNCEITSKRFGLYDLSSELIVGDAENLPYTDNSMDFVYSFGVIHHSPGTRKIVSEIYRVLKPSGRCFVTVYHKNSVFFWWTIFVVEFLLKRGFRRRSIQQQTSLIEYPNNNENMVIKLYRRKEFEELFHSFYTARSYVKHLLPIDIAFFSLIYMIYDDPNKPTPILTRIGNRFGWYIVIEAVK